MGSEVKKPASRFPFDNPKRSFIDACLNLLWRTFINLMCNNMQLLPAVQSIPQRDVVVSPSVFQWICHIYKQISGGWEGVDNIINFFI